MLSQDKAESASQMCCLDAPASFPGPHILGWLLALFPCGVFRTGPEDLATGCSYDFPIVLFKSRLWPPAKPLGGVG